MVFRGTSALVFLLTLSCYAPAMATEPVVADEDVSCLDSLVEEDGHLGLLQYQARSLIVHSGQRPHHTHQASASSSSMRQRGQPGVHPHKNHTHTHHGGAAAGSYLGKKHSVDEADEKVRDAAVASADGGLQVEFWYFDDYPMKLADIHWSAKPAMVRVDPHIDYEDEEGSSKPWRGLDRLDMFAARWTGSLHIAKKGTYTFELGSDDGSKLMINQKEVVDNDGLHGFRTEDGEMSLDKGSYDLQVDFFESQGEGAAVLSYKGPDTGGVMKVIPSSALSPPSQSLSPPTARRLLASLVTFSHQGDGSSTTASVLSPARGLIARECGSVAAVQPLRAVVTPSTAPLV
mmetsp:Transcript_36645/g.85898  ORF Transcript_36645/g.85898 Transcript_36645/m.85898 type:complete len:346 (-) Transcript_36645:2479-3516(-)